MNRFKPGTVKISIRDIFFIIFFKIHIVIGVFSLIVLTTNAYFFSIKPLYKASAYLLLKPTVDSRQLFFGGGSFDVYPVTELDVNTELEILESRELVIDVVKKLRAEAPPPEQKKQQEQADIFYRTMSMEQAIKYIKSNLEISSISASSAIKIKKTSESPELAAKIVNTYIGCYIEKHIEVHKPSSGVDFYNNQILLHKQKIKE
ncbi:MAG: hypothetical protein D3908_12725, partial [Candidatus Electrothrix sp. AUS4]|nr:hypothetical protein [Candidatus Electrothrix sp. AUS4]